MVTENSQRLRFSAHTVDRYVDYLRVTSVFGLLHSSSYEPGVDYLRVTSASVAANTPPIDNLALTTSGLRSLVLSDCGWKTKGAMEDGDNKLVYLSRNSCRKNLFYASHLRLVCFSDMYLASESYSHISQP